MSLPPHRRRLLAAFAAVLLPVLCQADPDECTGPSSDCVAVGHWDVSVAVGGGVRTNPVADSTNIPLLVIPHISYYGRHVFLDNLDVGFTVHDGESNTLSLVASPGYDRVFFYRHDLQNFFIEGLPTSSNAAYTQGGVGPQGIAQFPPRPRQWTYLAGPEWTYHGHGVTAQVDLLHDVTGRNNGDEVRAALSLPLLESHGTLTATTGVTWKSESIVNYYYGQPGFYEGAAALSPFGKLSYRHSIGGHWQLEAFAHYERLGRSIVDSPIVSEHYVATVFIGANYSL